MEKILNLSKPKNSVKKARQELSLTMSLSLNRKLIENAQHEGISPEELACELISEGLVLRAWELVEQKKILQKNSQNNSFSNTRTQQRNYKQNNYNNQQQNQNNRKGYQPRNNYNKRGYTEQYKNKNPKYFDPNSTDQARFLEYVRNQEKNS